MAADKPIAERHVREANAEVTYSEGEALSLLKQKSQSAAFLEQLSRSKIGQNRKVRLALVEHSRTPRHVSLPIIGRMYTFDLMRIALSPAVATDVKVAAEEAIIKRLETISAGERQTLAKRASARVAGALLLDAETRVVRASLENPRLTEADVIRAIGNGKAPEGLAEVVCRHKKWSLRSEIRAALLHSANTPLRYALEFARALPVEQVRQILKRSRQPANIRQSLLKHVAECSKV